MAGGAASAYAPGTRVQPTGVATHVKGSGLPADAPQPCPDALASEGDAEGQQGVVVGGGGGAGGGLRRSVRPLRSGGHTGTYGGHTGTNGGHAGTYGGHTGTDGGHTGTHGVLCSGTAFFGRI